MAGCWEEVGQAKGGTASGTELGKRGETDEVAVVQANRTWAGLWNNFDFEFSEKVIAQNGTCHSGLQKTRSEKFALKLDSSLHESRRGDRLRMRNMAMKRSVFRETPGGRRCFESL
jgi:hypothetical protein